MRTEDGQAYGLECNPALCVCVSVTGSMLASLKISVSNVQIVMSASESAASVIHFLSLMLRLFFYFQTFLLKFLLVIPVRAA